MSPPDNWYDLLVSAYPKRDGGGKGRKLIERLMQAAIAGGAEWETILKGAQNYKVYCGRKQMIGTHYVQMLQTFIGRDWHFQEWAEMDLRTPQQIAEEAAWADLERRAVKLGYSEVSREKGLTIARMVIEDQERAQRTREVVVPMHRKVGT